MNTVSSLAYQVQGGSAGLIVELQNEQMGWECGIINPLTAEGIYMYVCMHLARTRF